MRLSEDILDVLPEVFILLPVKVVLQDGHQLRHLTEEKDSMSALLQLWEYSVEQLKLSRSPLIVYNYMYILYISLQ